MLVLIGSKEGLAHLPLAVINPGDISLVPDPCYPIYRSSSIFAGGEVHTMPLESKLGFRPNLEAIPADVFSLARLMFLNYPNNPTGATADLSFFEKVVELARANEFVVAQDAAYNEMYYETPPPSILEVPGAKDVTIEFHSLSKTFNMTGWRIGFAIGGSSAHCGSWPAEGEHGFGGVHGHPVRRHDGAGRVPQTWSSDSSTLQRASRCIRGGAAAHRLASFDARGEFLCVDPLPCGIYIGGAVHAIAG